MISGVAVPAKIQEYAATSMNLQTKDEIFSAMVVYGFLSYENGKVVIPNKELMEKFTDTLRKEPALGYIYNLARESERMLKQRNIPVKLKHYRYIKTGRHWIASQF